MKKILIISRDPAVDFRQTLHGDGTSHDERYRFFINDFECEPDFVVVKSKGLREEHLFNVPRQRTILLTEEPFSVLEYPRGYYQQFGVVCSCQEEIKPFDWGLIHYCQAAIPWYVGVSFGKDGCHFPLDYATIAKAQPKKEKLISVISSTKSFSEGHVDRLRFIKALKQRYGSAVDIFGHGFKDFDDKWEVLAPYKYHIVIENSASKYYWTEKLADCYLAGTYPIYHGSSTINEYFPEQAMTKIDIRQPEETFRIIDSTLTANTYEQHTELLSQCKKLVLDDYNLFTLIAKTCDAIDQRGNTQIQLQQTCLKPASKFFSLHNLWNYTLGRTLWKLLGRRFL